jgi:hypothetical protein
MDRPTAPPAATSALSAEAGAPEALEDNYAFVMNVARLVGADGFMLGSGHQLRRANAAESDVIREELQYVTGRPRRPMPWEWRVVAGGSVERLKKEDWRYHVISFRGPNKGLLEIEEAFNLAPLELKIGLTILNQPETRGVAFYPGRLFQLLENAMENLVFVDVTASDIEEVVLIRAQLQQHDHRLVDVKRLARQLEGLDAVPAASPLRFLGYFAILESLLTHPPKQTDPYDSITRQVKKKLALLEHRCQPRIDYSSFAKADKQKVWGKMYSYRSLLAHGGATTFDGELQMLRSHENALELLKQTVKAIIRQALIEPQLLADLKDC